jgi:hypothetical protein
VGTLSGQVVGDGLVPVESAFGRHQEPRLALQIPESRQWVGQGVGHLDLLNRLEVNERINGWLTAA